MQQNMFETFSLHTYLIYHTIACIFSVCYSLLIYFMLFNIIPVHLNLSKLQTLSEDYVTI